MSKCRVILVRHGQSEGNLYDLFLGHMDMDLTELGKKQAEKVTSYFKDVEVDAIFSSDLLRAYHTACPLAKLKNLPIIKCPNMREIFAGEWEGKTYSQLEDEFADSYGVWRRQIGLAQCPSGESVAQLQQRIRACVEDIVRRHPNETVCVATHATPIRVMECVWTGTPLENMHTIPWVSNASVTIAEYDEDGVGRLVERDLHEHLGGLHTVLAKNV